MTTEQTTAPFVYDWRYAKDYDSDGNSVITSVIIRSDKLLTAKQALKTLQKEQERYKPSNYKSFKPVAGVSHFAVWGWSTMYETVLFANMEDFNNASFASEPKGKYQKARKTFIYALGN